MSYDIVSKYTRRARGPLLRIRRGLGPEIGKRTQSANTIGQADRRTWQRFPASRVLPIGAHGIDLHPMLPRCGSKTLLKELLRRHRNFTQISYALRPSLQHYGFVPSVRSWYLLLSMSYLACFANCSRGWS